MADFNVRSDAVNVEQLMEQIRGRIREKRGVDYTEQELRELAAVKLEKFLDPRAVRSDLLEQFRKSKPPEFPVHPLSEGMLFETHRPALRLIRRIFRPLLKLFFNPNRMVQAINEMVAQNQAARYNADHLSYEVLHNTVVELTRLGIELRNLKMRVESLAGRLELNERRERALEGVVMYRPSPEERYEAPAPRQAPPPRSSPPRSSAPPAPPVPAQIVTSPAAPAADERNDGGEPAGQAATGAVAPAGAPEGPGQRSRRRRRRRGRRGTGAPRPGGAPGDGASADTAATGGGDGGDGDGDTNYGPAGPADGHDEDA